MILKVPSYPNQSAIVWTTNLAWRWGGLLHTLVCSKCFRKLLRQAPLLLQLQITAAEPPSTIFKKQSRFVLILQVWGEKTLAAAVFKGNAPSPEGKDTQDLLGNTDLSRNINARQQLHMFRWPNLLSKRPWFSKPSSNSSLCTLPGESHLCSVYGWIFCTVMSESRTPSSTPICRMSIPFCRSVSWLTFTSRIISTRLFFLGSREIVDSTHL